MRTRSINFGSLYKEHGKSKTPNAHVYMSICSPLGSTFGSTKNKLLQTSSAADIYLQVNRIYICIIHVLFPHTHTHYHTTHKSTLACTKGTLLGSAKGVSDEVLLIGKNFREAFQGALKGDQIGCF